MPTAQVPRDAPGRVGAPAGDPDATTTPRWLAELACCCPSRPMVQVVLPGTAARPRAVDLLMCSHHFRICRERLLAAGASVVDRSGAVLCAGEAAF